jgi:hypothetical protein
MSLDNERVRFYFRNCNNIETWAALRTEAAVAVHEWLCSLEEHVRRWSAELGDDVVMQAMTSESEAWPYFRLYRLSWERPGERTPVAVCLQWARSTTTLYETNLPYVGLSVGKDDPLSVALRSSEEGKQARKRLKHQVSPYYLGWGRVPATGALPEAADEYRDVLREALRGAWEAYAPLVDQAVVVSAPAAP